MVDYFLQHYDSRVAKMIEHTFDSRSRLLGYRVFLYLLNKVQKHEPATRKGVFLEIGQCSISRHELADAAWDGLDRVRYILRRLCEVGEISATSSSKCTVVTIINLWHYVRPSESLPEISNEDTGTYKDVCQPEGKFSQNVPTSLPETKPDDERTYDESRQPVCPSKCQPYIDDSINASVDVPESESECAKRPNDGRFAPVASEYEKLCKLRLRWKTSKAIKKKDLDAILLRYCHLRQDNGICHGPKSCANHVDDCIGRMDKHAKTVGGIENYGGFLWETLRRDVENHEDIQHSWIFEKHLDVEESRV
jgi:hypothetical protein